MLYPMFMMVILTLSVGVLAFFTRVKSVKAGQMQARNYKLMDAQSYPEAVTKTTRNFNNQFETPVLFYVACLAYIALDISSFWGVLFAWLFVLSRVIHSVIHITYNHLLHRIIAFWLGCFMVLFLWIHLMLSVL